MKGILGASHNSRGVPLPRFRLVSLPTVLGVEWAGEGTSRNQIFVLRGFNDEPYFAYSTSEAGTWVNCGKIVEPTRFGKLPIATGADLIAYATAWVAGSHVEGGS